MSDPLVLGMFWFIGATAVISTIASTRIRIASIALFFSFNNLYFGNFPGVKEGIYVYDIAPFVLIMYAAYHRVALISSIRHTFYTLVLLVLWPFFSEFISSLNLNHSGNKWILWLLRSIELYLYYLIGFIFAAKIGIKYFMIAFCSTWSIYCFCGLLQYAGIMDTDFSQISALIEWEFISILEQGSVPVSFLGFNRGAVGVISSGVFCYALTVLFYNENTRFINYVYFTSITLSITLLLVSGSRTGLVAAFLGAIVVVLLNKVNRIRNLGYLILLGIVSFVLTIYMSDRLIEIISERFLEAKSQGMENYSVASRFEIQLLALSHMSSDLLSFLYGELNGTAHFKKTLRLWLSHPHNEYIAILWENGIIGLLLYLFFIFNVLKKFLFLEKIRQNSTYNGLFAMTCSSMITSLSVGGIIVPYNRLMGWSAVVMLVYGMAHREYMFLSNQRLKL